MAVVWSQIVGYGYCYPDWPVVAMLHCCNFDAIIVEYK